MMFVLSDKKLCAKLKFVRIVKGEKKKKSNLHVYEAGAMKCFCMRNAISDRHPSLSLAIIPLLLQMSWSAGTQCVAKGDHKKPKPGELAYRKGDILTIVDTSTVQSNVKAATDSVCCQGCYFPPFDTNVTLNAFFFFVEERILQSQTQHHRGGRTHKLHQCT